jgi:hypothetical protein
MSQVTVGVPLGNILAHTPRRPAKGKESTGLPSDDDVEADVHGGRREQAKSVAAMP